MNVPRPNDPTVIGGYDIGYSYGTTVTLHELNHEFAHYVLDYLARLIGLEEEQLGRDGRTHLSGLRVFVRLDISLYRDHGDGKLHYMVNEVTRGHASALLIPYTQEIMPDSVRMFLGTVARAILSYTKVKINNLVSL